MKLVLGNGSQKKALEDFSKEISAKDRDIFLQKISQNLSSAQKKLITEPASIFPRQTEVLAIHWHPEFVPLNLVSQRISAMFPGSREELVIPTQHNELMVYGPYAGVEVDCYSKSFNQKVQLLLHFSKERVDKASVLKAMLKHTFRYRSSQLFDFMHALTKPDEQILSLAASHTGASDDLIDFVRTNVGKVEKLLLEYQGKVPETAIKNKLLKNFMDGLRDDYGDAWINRAQIFLQNVKLRVKEKFPLHYFYRTQEVIEEARAFGGRIVIPHPEQFWPILLADYDVDGYEVWNPQSRRYTDFLIDVVSRKNKQAEQGKNRLLIFMGDDTHLSEKVLAPGLQDSVKAQREVGLQPAWEDLAISKKLIQAGLDRRAVMKEYSERLDSQTRIF